MEAVVIIAAWGSALAFGIGLAVNFPISSVFKIPPQCKGFSVSANDVTIDVLFAAAGC